jgi:hypothetical protein
MATDHTGKNAMSERRDWSPVFIWICGYGFGISAGADVAAKSDRCAVIAMILGWTIGFSGWFWHYMQKPGGGIDRITDLIMLMYDRTMLRKHGGDYADARSKAPRRPK